MGVWSPGTWEPGSLGEGSLAGAPCAGAAAGGERGGVGLVVGAGWWVVRCAWGSWWWRCVWGVAWEVCWGLDDTLARIFPPKRLSWESLLTKRSTIMVMSHGYGPF